MLIRGAMYSKLFDLAQAWKHYADAMDRRRPGSALTHNAFGHYARRCDVYCHNGSALFGQMNEWEGQEVFCVSHQAPRTHREGVALLKKLAGDRHVRACLAVTSDLVSMLERIGFRNTGKVIPCNFRGDVVLKHILVNF
jgi:hypothetical protein